MNTDDLIALLARDADPVDMSTARRRLAIALAGGAAGGVLLMFVLLGLNPRFGMYLSLPMHWVKVGFTVALLLTALVTAVRLAKPGVRLAWAPALLAAPVAIIWMLAIAALLGADPAQRSTLIYGQTWAVCPTNIVVLSAPAFVLMFWALKALAPTRPRWAGAAAGLTAGALGAAAYTLHCPELAAPFIAIWYLIGILIPTAIGALIGPWVLRW
jgi:hypothetical protein